MIPRYGGTAPPIPSYWQKGLLFVQSRRRFLWPMTYGIATSSADRHHAPDFWRLTRPTTLFAVWHQQKAPTTGSSRKPFMFNGDNTVAPFETLHIGGKQDADLTQTGTSFSSADVAYSLFTGSGRGAGKMMAAATMLDAAETRLKVWVNGVRDGSDAVNSTNLGDPTWDYVPLGGTFPRPKLTIATAPEGVVGGNHFVGAWRRIIPETELAAMVQYFSQGRHLKDLER